jgi:tetratricopeptide (TPR) repeat protein
MPRLFSTFVCSVLVVVGFFPACSKAAQDKPGTKPAAAATSADELFQAGDFAEAGRLYAEAVAWDAQNYHATLRLGEIALLANRLEDAEKWLRKAIDIKPDDKAAKLSLAQAYYQRYLKAATRLGQAGNGSRAKLLESFRGMTPYDILGQGEETSAKFVANPQNQATVGIGGGGKVKSVPFILDKLALGGDAQRNARGLYEGTSPGQRPSVSGSMAWWDTSSFGTVR